ncbi:MAG: hypothetical protein PHH85_08270 [Candidatus Methanoperedens sp.]|nr:hypothetical protein [Candidatus Methanoperedens sp.]
MTRDFTLSKYEALCKALISSGNRSITVQDYIQGQAVEPFVILRHDVDRRPEMALEMAGMEKDMGIRATYYFRMVPGVFEPGIIKMIRDMGHEIGYHYEVLDKVKGDKENAIVLFEKELKMFREVADVKTACMHGNPIASWSNRDMWQEYDFKDFDIIGEPYLSIDYKTVLYLTDTGRNWENKFSVKDIVTDNIKERIKSTDDIIKLIKSRKYQQMCILAHPNRWTDNAVLWTIELFWQNIKNIGKAIIKATS